MDKKKILRTGREAVSYAKLNFQRCLYQGKTLAVLLCILLFFATYLGNVRDGLISHDQILGIEELFLAVTNTIYISFTIWAGYILLICDIPYQEEGVYQYLLRSSKRGWLWGQLLYILGITLFYFAYIFLLLVLLTVPRLTICPTWTDAFVQMINRPSHYGIEKWFTFPVWILRTQAPQQLFPKCVALCLLTGLCVSSLTILLRILWREGPGIVVGGVGLVFDFWATAIEVQRPELLFFSPLSLSRVGNISASSFNTAYPSFGYACCFLGGIVLISVIFMRLRIRRYEFR